MAQYAESGWQHPESIFSTYLPPGWDLDRLRSATRSQLDALSDSEFEKLRHGIIAACPWGIDEPKPTAALLHTGNDQQVESDTAILEPSDAKSRFVVYRTTYSSQANWTAWKRKFTTMVQRLNAGSDEKIAFELIDDSTLDGASATDLLHRTRSHALGSEYSAPDLCFISDDESIQSFARADESCFAGKESSDQSCTPYLKLLYSGADDPTGSETIPRAFKIVYFAMWEELTSLMRAEYPISDIGLDLAEDEAWAGIGEKFVVL